ncbi:MAG: rhodanese-like domain-containing protein [Bacteroidia bacterium]
MKKLNKFIYLLTTLLFSLTLHSCSGQSQSGVKEFEELLKQKNIVLIDVRTPGEFSSGHIEGAKNIDVYDPAFTDKILKIDKQKTVLVYCRSGNRSAQAAGFLRSKGYKVFDLAGGIGKWQAAGKKVVY